MEKEKVNKIPADLEITHRELFFRIGDLYLEVDKLFSCVLGLFIALSFLSITFLLIVLKILLAGKL